MDWTYDGPQPLSPSAELFSIILLGELLRGLEERVEGGANAAPVETLGEPIANPRVTHGQPSANPGETQRVPKTPENGAIAAETPPFFPGKTPESGGVDRSEGCAICTPSADNWPPPDGSAPGPGLVDDACLAPDVTPPSRQHRDQAVTLRDAAVTTAQGWCNWCGLPETATPSQRQSLPRSLPSSIPRSNAPSMPGACESLPETPTQESAPMIVNPSAMPSDSGPTAAQVQALSGALDAAGKLHAQAFGSSTIRGLIEELGKCQQALAGFLPAIPENIPGLGAVDQAGIFTGLKEDPENFPDPDRGGIFSTSVEGKENIPDPTALENFPERGAGEHVENFPPPTARENIPALAQQANPVEKIPQGASSNPPENFPEGGQSAPRTGPGAVHALVSSALQAHDDHIAMLQAESTHLREQIEQVTERRREFLDFLQTGVARP